MPVGATRLGNVPSTLLHLPGSRQGPGCAGRRGRGSRSRLRCCAPVSGGELRSKGDGAEGRDTEQGECRLHPQVCKWCNSGRIASFVSTFASTHHTTRMAAVRKMRKMATHQRLALSGDGEAAVAGSTGAPALREVGGGREGVKLPHSTVRRQIRASARCCRSGGERHRERQRRQGTPRRRTACPAHDPAWDRCPLPRSTQTVTATMRL